MLRSLLQSKVNAQKDLAIGKVENASSKALIKYVLLFSLLISLYTLFSLLDPPNILFFYVGFSFYSLIIGIINILIMGKRFGWKNKFSFFEKLETTLLLILISYILSIVILYFLSPIEHLSFVFPTGVLWILFPLLAISVFDFSMAIPSEEYKKWVYPLKMEIPDLDKIDFANSYVLTFEVHKKDNERLPTFMKFKAPLSSINFGDLFYMYLYEYNDRNRESPIEYMDSSQKLYSWLFYVKPKRWWNSKLMIDPSLTVRENKIKENVVIVPYRV